MNNSKALAALTSQLIEQIVDVLDPAEVANATALGYTATWLRGVLSNLTAGEITTDRLASTVGLLADYRKRRSGR